MTDPDYGLAVPISIRYHQEAFDQILESIKEGTYCAVLGPRLCGKSVLLRYLERTLSGYGWPCLYIDLQNISTATLQGFFTDLSAQYAAGLCTLTETEIRLPAPGQASSAVFRGFLEDSLKALKQDLVLILDNLDAIPTDLIQALLTSLRAAYMDQQSLDHRITIVVSGALSLATLTVGESSPFRGIASTVFVGDLSEEQSHSMIADYLAAEQVTFTWQAQQRLLNATRGDAYLIRKLCQRCVEAVRATVNPRLGAKNVNRVTRAFLRNEMHEYEPLREAVRLIEENPDLMRCLLILLETETARKSELPLPLSPDLDPLYLTGVVEQTDGGQYRLQNAIYRYFLAEHFQPGRVGHMLSLAGLWDEALDYLEAGVRTGDQQSRLDLLPATIQSMYAAPDLGQAAYFLTRGLLVGFGGEEIQVWYAAPGENRLRLIGLAGDQADPSLWSEPELHLQADRLEARAYRQAAAVRGGENRKSIQRAIPLKIPGRNPVGVVVVKDKLPGENLSANRDRDWEMIGFLSQAARAMEAIGIRRQELTLAGRMQASLLPEEPPSLAGWDFSATWRPARETSGDFYDFIEFGGGKIGIILADVTDKGMGAALYMALCRTLLRTYAGAYPDSPATVLHKANQRMLADTHGGFFISVFYGLLDPKTGQMDYCNAGHHPPYHLPGSKKGDPATLPRTGMPLGVSPEASWDTSVLTLHPDELLLLYTDGVVEAHNADQDQFGHERMLEIAYQLKHRSTQDVNDAIVSEVRAFTGSEGQFDDLTMVLVKRL